MFIDFIIATMRSMSRDAHPLCLACAYEEVS
jgi:hypothetical protein